MSVINTNIGAMKAANASSQANKMLGTAMERLSTGKRINSSKDDAAGLAIASSMTSQIRGMNQGIRNANDGISMAQTAEGALNEVTNMLQRMRELTVQASNGTYQDSDKANMQAEMDVLAKQVHNVLTNTEFNGNKLFTGAAGTGGTVNIQAGSESTDVVELDFSELDLSAVISDEGASVVTLAATQTPALDGDGDPILDGDGNPTYTDVPATLAAGSMDLFDSALTTVATTRANLGAAQSQLESAVNNLTSNVTNLSDARSRIEDTDYTAETTALAKAQILSQASTAMLSQANQSQQNVLSLLR